MLGVLDIDAKKHNPPVLVSLPSGFQSLRLGTARWTPRGLEVKKDHLPTKIFKRDRSTTEDRQGKGRGLPGDQGRLNIARIPAEAIRQ